MLNERIRHDRSSRGIEKALENLCRIKPQLENIARAFGPLLVAKATFKEEWHHPQGVGKEEFTLDTHRFSQGEPLFVHMGMIDFHEDLPAAARHLLPPMKQAFKGINKEIEKMSQHLSTNGIDARESIHALVNDNQKTLNEQAEKMEISLPVFTFILGQLAKPFLEMQSPIFAPLTEGHQWLHGYCPVCGSHAAIAGLIGEGGKRWLQCSLCTHEWRFNRNTCPRCNDNNHENQEYFFDKDSPLKAGERVDLCNNCKSYLLTIDLRQRIDPVNMEVAAMGMIPLDILAQEKGYTPIAATPWNSLS